MATSEEKGSVQMGFFFNNDGGGWGRDNGKDIGLFVVKRRGETSWLLLMLLLEIVVGEAVVAINCGEEEKGQREMGQFTLKEGC